MKRLLTLAVLFLCCMATSFAQFSGSGSGTESDPYLIMNPIQLNQLRNFLNQSGVYFKLMADIDLTEFLEDENPSQGWQPVGTSSTPFKGILDGNGKTISGFWINRPNSDYVGFFGSLYYGTVKNLTIKGGAVKGKDYVGFLSGEHGDAIFCSFEGSVSGASHVGGLTGHSANFTEVTAKIDVEGTGDYVGGFSGSANTISNCTLTSRYVKGNNYVGGFSGSGGIITGCTITSNYVSGNNSVGGVCGNQPSEIASCYAYTNVTGNDDVGGICGIAKKTFDSGNSTIANITKCGFVGDVSGNSYLGGICGEYTGEAEMNECFAIGHITAKGNYAGGVIGCSSGYIYYNYRYSSHHYYHYNNIQNTYFSGSVTGKEFVGGLIGYKEGGDLGVKYCYANTSVVGTKSVGGLCGKIDDTTIKSNAVIATSVKATVSGVGRVYGERDGGTIGTLGTTEENKALNRTIIIEAGVAKDATDGEQHGSGVSPTTLKLKATYVAMGWDFNDTWAIQETECYPYIQTQTAPPVLLSKVVSGATEISGKCVDGGTVTLEIDGVKQQMVSSNHEFSFTVSPLQAGHDIRLSAKVDGKEQSYYTTETVAYLGKGTEADPYQVYTAADLTGVYRKGYFKLMNDIDLTEYINKFSPTEGWEAIGREGSETIHFDGNGHKITGLWCNTTRDNTGLFSCFANGTIKNLRVETAKGKQVKGGANTGILIGKMMNGTIENCRVVGTLADGTPVGGLVGLFEGGRISLCQASVTINTTLENSYVGGIVGDITNGTIDQCVTMGTLTATGKESFVGGLVGRNRAAITNSYSNATVHASYIAAGLVALNYNKVEKCYATGDLYSNNYAAGVIGINDGSNAVVKNCVAMNNKIEVVYESQQEQQDGHYGQRIIGGIPNGAPVPELNNYALKTMQVSVNNDPQKVNDDFMNGVGKNGSELAKATTYQELGWDFSETWAIAEGEGYPSLKKNEAVVVKPGEDEPEPEPVLSTDDQLVVDEVTASKGKTVAVGIGLTNKDTDLTAYQFDLTLPAGFTLAMDGKKYQVTKTARYEDDGQTLNVSAVEGSDRTYRFVSFSLSNSVITETSGAILNAIVEVADNVEPGSYEALLSAIVFTKADGTQVKLNNVKFNFVVSSVTKGDTNDDGDINVSDIVEIVNCIMGKPSAKFVKAAADMNGDGDVNVTDIVMVVNSIMGSGNAGSRSDMDMASATVNDVLMLTDELSLRLENNGNYVAAQFDVRVSDGQTIDDISLNGERSGRHLLTYAKTGENLYKVVLYSLDNSSFSGHSGELLSIRVSGNGDVTLENIVFVTAGNAEKRFAPIGGNVTGLKAIDNLQFTIDNCYDLQGRRVTATKKGIYVVNGKKHVVR